jgi:hypothetical protein
MKKIFLYAILAIAFVSCGSARQFVKFTDKEPLSEDKGRVYVMLRGNHELSIFCDDELTGRIDKNGYLAFDLPVGLHKLGATPHAHAGITLGAAEGEDIFKMNIKGGRTYYLELVFRGNVRNVRYAFRLLDEEAGKTTLRHSTKPQLNYID